MTLSVLEKRRWGSFTVAVLFWTAFVFNIPTILNYPWNVLDTLLGLLSPIFWYKALDISHNFEHGCEGESTDAATARTKTAFGRAMYIGFGAASWGIFVYNTPPHPVDPQPVLRGIVGFLSPFLWSASALLNFNNNFFWQVCLGIDKRNLHEGKRQSKNARNRIGWAFFIAAWTAWGFFVAHVPFVLSRPWDWYVYSACLGSVSPYLLLNALYLSMVCVYESRGDRRNQKERG